MKKTLILFVFSLVFMSLATKTFAKAEDPFDGAIYGRFTSIDDGFSIGLDMRLHPTNEFYINLDPTLGVTFEGFFTTDIGVGIGGIIYEWNEDEWNNGDLAVQGGLTVGYTFYGGEFADDFRLGINAAFVSRFFTQRTVGMFTKLALRFDFFKSEFGVDFGIGPTF